MGLGLRFRDATDDDYPHFVAAWGQLGVEHTPPDAATWSAQLRPHTLFADGPDGDVAAYALIFALGGRGDVRQVAVAPSWRNRGVGRAVMAELARRLRAAGCRDWRLEVRADNAPAIALYRRAGMTVLHEITVFRLAPATFARRSPDLVATEVTPEHDADVEARFDLGAGQLARWRVRVPGEVFWQVRDGERAGLARRWRGFMPTHDLMWPFRATDAAVAAHLVAQLADGGGASELELPVTDPPVGAALLAAGARVHERQLEMGGPL